MTQEKIDHLYKIRHTASHALASAVKKLYPDVQLGFGPVIDTGFYYDFSFPQEISDKDLSKIEKEMKKVLRRNLEMTGKEVTAEEAKAEQADQPFKHELIDEYAGEGKKLTLYTLGDFVDLCKGGHVDNTKEMNPEAIHLTGLAGAYWRGNEKNPMLTRIYAAAFETPEELEKYLTMMEQAKERDHRKLGKELDLFVFSDVVGKGLPLWTEKGTTIRRELERFIVDEEIKRGYKHVYTPDLAKTDLYKKSGHYPYYKDSMYAPMKVDEEELILRPMSCPHHFELFLSKPRSYKESPMRIAELAKLYRYEKSGELTGLIRLRGFCLSDAHIICKDPKQAGEEISGALDLIEYTTSLLGFNMGEHYSYRLSLGDRNEKEKYYKDDKAWDEAEEILRKTLQSRKCTYVEAENEAAFYGPKIDVQMKNVRGKEDTAFTVQYDFVMPKRFNLNFIDERGKEKEAIVVHRSSIGAVERTIAFLLEYTAGNLPLWLSPVQVALLPVADAHTDFANSLANTMRETGLRVEVDDAKESVGKKIRNAAKQKIPYVIVVGEKEKTSGVLPVRKRGAQETVEMKLEDFVDYCKKNIAEKSLEL